MADVNTLDNVISKLDTVRSLKQVKSEKTKVDLIDVTKCIYDFTKEQFQRETSALPELITEGFDDEQIWQQLELQNEDELTYLFNRVTKVLASKQLRIPLCSTKPESVQMKNDEEELDDEEGRDMSSNEESEKESELKSSKKTQITKKKMKSSIVDDKFFNLQECHKYLNKEEKREMQNDVESNVESDDESIDLFDDYSDEDEDEDSEKKHAKYADFFGHSGNYNEQYEENINSDHNDMDISKREESEDEDEEMITSDNEEDRKEQGNKRVRFNLTNNSDETDSLDNKAKKQRMDENEEKDKKNDVLLQSSLESRQQNLKTRIKELENEMMDEKPWQLKGEVSASERPQNSLLEEFLEVSLNKRPRPVITYRSTNDLEDVFKRRIKDKTWDETEKKFKPIETPLEYKKKLVLNQEKSKESLSQIYEQEYLKQRQNLEDPENKTQEEEMPESHNQIQEMMRSLIHKLDALCNYHYTPKLIKPEIKIISNLPAINAEEVGPTAVSEATLLAPEQIRAKERGELMDKAERTKTDMKRERRRKKLRQRNKQKAMEEKAKVKPLTPGICRKYKTKENTALVKKLTKDKKINMDEMTRKVIKTSTAFFAELQNQAQTSQARSKMKKTQKKNKALP